MQHRTSALKVLIIAAIAIAAGIFIYGFITRGPSEVAKSPQSSSEIQSSSELRYYAIDVGQGDASLFIFPNGQTMLIDAGIPDNAKNLVAFLKKEGVKKIDYLVATHAHSDHFGGMRAVMNAFEIGRVWDSGFIHGSKLQADFYQTIKERKIQFGRPKRGFSEKIGDAAVEVIAPAKELRNTPADTNNNSLVLRISYGQASFLITGDMQREEWRSVAPLPRTTLLKAAHHGSSNGTNAQLLSEVRPSFIVFSYGRGNPYGHPHKKVTRLIAKHSEIKRFDTVDGTIKFSTDGKSISYPKEREVTAKN